MCLLLVMVDRMINFVQLMAMSPIVIPLVLVQLIKLVDKLSMTETALEKIMAVTCSYNSENNSIKWLVS